MTIFDSLRFPVSYPPTAEELDAIPVEILEEWAPPTNWTAGKSLKPLSRSERYDRYVSLCSYYNTLCLESNPLKDHQQRLQEHHIQEIILLRTMIKEYNSD